MLFQTYGERALFQLLGWLLVFAGLILTNEIARRSKKGGIFFFLLLPGALTVYFVSIYVGAAMGAQWALNALVLAIIIKRSIQQKKNPYKNEIFTDTRDFQLAMARAGE